jgi:hypothetical protein
MKREMKSIAIGSLGMTLLLAGCGDSGDGSSTDDVGNAGTAGVGGSSGAAGEAGASGETGEAGTGGSGSAGTAGTAGTGGEDNPFTGDSGLPDAVPWGPVFIGVQNAVDGTEQRDIGFAIFWEPSEVWVQYVDDDCIGYGTLRDHNVGRDAGTITIIGGSLVASQDLTLNDNGYYYLDGGANAWAPGDAVSASVDGYTFDTVQIPTPVDSAELEAATTVSRSADFEFAFSGSDSSMMAATISGGNDDIGYMLVCISDASSGTFTVPATAWASFPEGLEGINFKLTPANLTQDQDAALIAAGEDIEVSLALED